MVWAFSVPWRYLVLEILNDMTITIKDRQVELRHSFRAYMCYERITGETFAPKGITEYIIFFYSTVVSSDRELMLGYDEFIDILDARPELIEEFTAWFTSTVTRQSSLASKQEKEDAKQDAPKSKKKARKA